MSGGRLPKRIMFRNLEVAVRRGRGGKEKEWTDCVQSDIRAFVLRMAGVARVDRRLRRYYLNVRLLPNVFVLACRSLGSIYYDTGSPHDGKTPFGWLHPCRLVTDSRRYLIVGVPAAMPLYSSFIFSLNNRASTIS